MKHIVLGCALALMSTVAFGQSDKPAQSAAPEPLARHLVMFTREGPNFAKLREHMDDARAHQKIYQQLAAEGHTVAGGAFEGLPVFGMTIFSEGVDEARARELIKDDHLPKLGIVAYEFRTLGVRMGSLTRN